MSRFVLCMVTFFLGQKCGGDWTQRFHNVCVMNAVYAALNTLFMLPGCLLMTYCNQSATGDQGVAKRKEKGV